MIFYIENKCQIPLTHSIILHKYVSCRLVHFENIHHNVMCVEKQCMIIVYTV